MPTVHDLAQRASCALHESSWARPREEANLSQERRGEIAENSRTMQLARARRLGEEVFREDVASARCVRDVDRSARRAASSKGRFLHRLDDRRGVFVFEVSYLVDVFEKTLFDTIYHEHVAYHSVKPLQQFFADNRMELISAKRIGTHGGSLRGVAQLRSGPHIKQPSVNKMIALEACLGLDQAKTFEAFGRHTACMQKTHLFVSASPRVCPEPVLVKRSRVALK